MIVFQYFKNHFFNELLDIIWLHSSKWLQVFIIIIIMSCNQHGYS